MNASDVFDYLNGKRVDGLPAPPDTYRPGHITWGSDPKRGRAIQRSRANKQREANRAALLPLLASLTFTHDEALEVARLLDHEALALAHGWQYWQKGNAASWVHESDLPKIARAKELGAARVK